MIAYAATLLLSLAATLGGSSRMPAGAPTSARERHVTIHLDAMDRVVGVDEALPIGGTHSTSTTYDAANVRRTDVDQATSLTTTTIFDAQGYARSVQNAEQQIVMTRDSAGTVLTRDTHGPHADADLSETFDAYGQPVTRDLAAALGLPPMSTSWTYGTSGEVTEM